VFCCISVSFSFLETPSIWNKNCAFQDKNIASVKHTYHCSQFWGKCLLLHKNYWFES
jgi:hypothetical protein